MWERAPSVVGTGTSGSPDRNPATVAGKAPLYQEETLSEARLVWEDPPAGQRRRRRKRKGQIEERVDII